MHPPLGVGCILLRAGCPAIFEIQNQRGKNMTFDQVLQFIRDPKIQRILADESSTDFQKAADIHAMMVDGATKPAPRARTIKPKPSTEPGNDGLI